MQDFEDIDINDVNQELKRLYERVGELTDKKSVHRFWTEGLTDLEQEYARKTIPADNFKIPVIIYSNPTSSDEKAVYTYRLDSFPRLLSVDKLVAWAAYINNYKFYCMGSYIFVRRKKQIYDFGTLQRNSKSTKSKKKEPKNNSSKFFK